MSEAEDAFEFACKALKLPPWEREYEFAKPKRKWRFDFAWPEEKVAVEIEGGVFIQGRHTRGVAFTKDCEKYNTATLMGWRILRFTPSMVGGGAFLTERLLKSVRTGARFPK